MSSEAHQLETGRGVLAGRLLRVQPKRPLHLPPLFPSLLFLLWHVFSGTRQRARLLHQRICSRPAGHRPPPGVGNHLPFPPEALSPRRRRQSRLRWDRLAGRNCEQNKVVGVRAVWRLESEPGYGSCLRTTLRSSATTSSTSSSRSRSSSSTRRFSSSGRGRVW